MRFDEHPFGNHLPSLHELTDASNECRHGRLPFDKGPRCGCWNIWWGPKEPPVKHHVYPEHVRRRAVRLYQEGLSLTEVGGRVGACRNSVRAWVVEAGVVVRGRWAA